MRLVNLDPQVMYCTSLIINVHYLDILSTSLIINVHYMDILAYNSHYKCTLPGHPGLQVSLPMYITWYIYEICKPGCPGKGHL
jgi:hypothetical protein